MKWYPLPPMKMRSGGRGGSFFRASGGCDFSYEPLPLGGGGLQYQFPVQFTSTGPKSVEVNLTSCQREVCRIKFY